MSFSRENKSLVLLSLALALLLSLVPLPAALVPFKPYWVALVVIYWAMETVDVISLGRAFVIGELLEILVIEDLAIQDRRQDVAGRRLHHGDILLGSLLPDLLPRLLDLFLQIGFERLQLVAVVVVLEHPDPEALVERADPLEDVAAHHRAEHREHRDVEGLAVVRDCA